MDIQKHQKLNSLKVQRDNLNAQQKLSKQRPWTPKQIGLYILGLYGVTIIYALVSTSIPIIPIIYALGTPVIIINKNKKKAKELEIEINDLNNQIIEIENDLNDETNNQLEDVNVIEDSLSVENKTILEILNKPYSESVITDEEDRPRLVKSIFNEK